MKKFLAGIGIEPERFRYEWISASEGEKFAEVMTEFHQTLLELGPLEFHKKLKRL